MRGVLSYDKATRMSNDLVIAYLLGYNKKDGTGD
ncbi:hypothetical protein NMY3_01544 [Candidatus Nitrosocosmicus oleophilus]|uniref:Uncharacterized protein n=1 Tax=Candidatus Nitrosocosmicus oleophilus TaxID=1353260 RepID=A0A654LXL0_9ARCH|nr:hypothetical protein NMY3_01544 [Candidatus Nitrosocosmicus oleophilus]